MIRGKDFPKLHFPARRKHPARKALTKVIGIDSEAYVSGEPFMFATDTGEVITPDEIPDIFFKPKYVNANFIWYNIKYDSGAVLRHLPRPEMEHLWRYGKAFHNGYTYRYVPHKSLSISQGKDRVNFWDISQFYRPLSLNRASKRYLHHRKKDTRTKRFSPSYVRRNWRHLSEYCIQDARLCGELGRYFISKLGEFGITASSLFSCASLSYQYFSEHTTLSSCHDLYKNEPKAVAMACDAYDGGKFEVTARGCFSGHSYDIVSAYPFEIRNLIDTTHARVHYSPKYQEDATYGFLRVRIDNSAGEHLPSGIKKNLQCVFPAGVYYTTVTKEEYDYMIAETSADVDILDGVWLYVAKHTYPYRQIIDDLFAIKKKYKGSDEMLTTVSKITMNSAYGKMAQVIWDEEKERWQAGPWWHPIHAAVITANTRIKVTRMQNLLKDKCLAVHTDSVMCLDPLPDSMVTGALGDFSHEVSGKGIVIACGLYEIAGKSKFRGFHMKKGLSWRRILRRHPNNRKLRLKQLHVESWIEAMAKNHPKDTINVFDNVIKVVDLNCDDKRNWHNEVRAKDLLVKLEYSTPHIVFEDKPPNDWLT